MALSKRAQEKAKATPTSEIVDKLLEGAAEPASTSGGILRKAGNLGVPSTLVFGGMVTGKSTVVRNTVLKAKLNPLWLALNNDTVLRNPLVKDWDVGSAATWDEFNANFLKPAVRGELKGYDAVVIDGGDILVSMALIKVSPNGQPDRAEYLMASNLVHDALVKLRERFVRLFMIVDVVTNKGERKINLNPYAYNNIIPLFADKFYTNVIRERGEDKKLTGAKSFTVQREADLSLLFINGDKVEG